MTQRCQHRSFILRQIVEADSNMASQLPFAAWKQAANFILDNGNDLQRRRFEYYFGDGDHNSVIRELKCYQNADGGFGHALDADLTSEHSSVICTTIAFQIMADLEVGADAAISRDGISYLEDQYQFNNWPNISAINNESAHAPWWQFDPNWHCTDKFLANPGAEILGYLLQYGTTLPNDTLDSLLQRCLRRLEEGDLEMHELQCYARLYHNAYVGRNYADKMLPALIAEASKLVTTDRNQWEEYGMTPVGLVTSPDSVFHDNFRISLEEDFEYQIEQQTPEGAWVPRWSWGGLFPDEWRQAETQIKVELTLNFLRQLQRFGKIATEQ